MLFYAFDHGITHFDLANNYGPPPGSAEINFGKILQKDLKAYRDELVISSKAGYLMWEGPYGEWGSAKHLISSLDQSLQRMKLEYVDIFYSHRPDPDTPLEETMSALERIVRQGKAIYVGLSNYSAEKTLEATSILESMGIKCLIHQPRYNMLDRWVEDGLLDTLEEKQMGCIPFSPLAQGQLSDKYLNGIPEDSRAAGQSIFLNKKDLTEEKIHALHGLNKIAKNRNQSLAQMALAWLLHKPQVTSVLIGASKVQQIEDSLKAGQNTKFTKEELESIDTIISRI